MFEFYNGQSLIKYDSMYSALWSIRENHPVRKLRCKQVGPAYLKSWQVYGESLVTGNTYLLGTLEEVTQ